MNEVIFCLKAFLVIAISLTIESICLYSGIFVYQNTGNILLSIVTELSAIVLIILLSFKLITRIVK